MAQVAAALLALGLWVARAVAVAVPRYVDGPFEPFPGCQAKYNAPCSHTNILRVVRRAKALLEAAPDADSVRDLLASINNGSYVNGADGFGFGPMVLNFDDGAVLADGVNPNLAGRSLQDILAYRADGCNVSAYNASRCFPPEMSIMQQNLLLRWQTAATTGDGLASWLWYRPDAPLSLGRKVSDQRVGFIQVANTTIGNLLVSSAFSNVPLPMPQPSCDTTTNEMCSIAFARRLLGDVLTRMTMAATEAEWEACLHDITFHPTMFKYPVGWYAFVYRYGFPGEPGEDGKAVAHAGRSDNVGKSLPEILASVGNWAVDGKSLHNSLWLAAESGGGWVNFPWKNSVTAPLYSKISFIAGVVRFGVRYYVGVGFNNVHAPIQAGPHCSVCSYAFSYPCAIRNAYILISHAQAMLLTRIDEDVAWSQLTTATNSSGWGRGESAGYIFDGGFYSFAFNFNGTNVAHGARGDFVGLTLWAILARMGINTGCNGNMTTCTVTSVDGVGLHNAFVRAAKAGGGWVRYSWRDSPDGPVYQKVAYIVKMAKYDRQFYVGVGYNFNRWQGTTASTVVNCSAAFAGACSEDNVLAVIGHLASAISNAQSSAELKAVFAEATNGTADGGLGMYKLPGGFVVQVYDDSNKCVAHGSDPQSVGKTLDSIFLQVGSKRISPGQFTERYLAVAPTGGWFQFDWQTAAMPSSETRTAYALKAVYSPLGSGVQQTYYLLSGFVVSPAPTRCEAGCPENSECQVSSGRCECKEGYGTSFGPSNVTCGQAFDLPMFCVDVRGKTCSSLSNGTLACSPCPGGYYCPAGSPIKCTLGKYCPVASVLPSLCKDGTVTGSAGAGSADACRPCPPGSSWSGRISGASSESVATCLNCTAGTYADLPGMSECEACGRGTFNADAGRTLCTNCSIGFFASESATTSCVSCALGEFSDRPGSSQCERCPEGRFSNVTSAEQCVACPQAGSNTKSVGARSADECICAEGSFLALSGGCQACPAKMTCPQGSSEAALRSIAAGGTALVDSTGQRVPYPLVDAQFWTAASDPLSVYRCVDTKHCPGGDPGTCAPFLEEQGCAHCQAGFYWDGGSCKVCAGQERSKWTFPVLPCILGFFIILVLYMAFRDPFERWDSWQNACMSLAFIALNHYQVLALIRNVNLALPRPVTATFGWWAFTEDVMSVWNMGCAGFVKYSDSMAFKAVVPAALLVVTLLCYVVSRVLAPLLRNRTLWGQTWDTLQPDRLWNVYFSLIFTFFNGIAAMSLSLFKCASNPNGKLTLTADPSLNCYEGEWNSLIVVAALAVVVYCVGASALFGWAICVATRRSNFSNRSFQTRWKFLFIKFRSDVHWWALVVLARGVVINAGFALVTQGLGQLYWVMMEETIYLSLSILYMPWRQLSANALSITGSLCAIYACALNSIYTERDSALDVQVGTMAATISFVPLVCASVLALWALLRGLRLRQPAKIITVNYDELIDVAKNITAMEPEAFSRLFQGTGEWEKFYITKFCEVVRSEFLGIENDGRTISKDTISSRASRLSGDASKASMASVWSGEIRSL